MHRQRCPRHVHEGHHDPVALRTTNPIENLNGSIAHFTRKALEALRDGRRERRFTMDELWHHATRQRVANVMRPYLEAITA